MQQDLSGTCLCSVGIYVQNVQDLSLFFIYMWQPGLTGDDAAYGMASDLQKGDAAASFTQ